MTFSHTQSNLFGHDLFCMGLNPRHLKEFQSKRVYSSVVLENVPQLILQITFLLRLGAFDEATFVALLSSTTSVILSVVDIWSAHRMLKVMDDKDVGGFNVNTIEFTILESDEINAKKRILLTRPRALAKAIAQTLVVDKRTIEIFQLIAAENGIKVGFTVYSVDYNVDDMVSELWDEENRVKMKLLIYTYWELEHYPDISDIYEGERNQDRTANTFEVVSPEEDSQCEQYWDTVVTRQKGQSINTLHPSSAQIQQEQWQRMRGYSDFMTNAKHQKGKKKKVKRSADDTFMIERMHTEERRQIQTNDPQLRESKLFQHAKMMQVAEEVKSLSHWSEEPNAMQDEVQDVDVRSFVNSLEFQLLMNDVQSYAHSQSRVYESHASSKDTPLRTLEDLKVSSTDTREGSAWIEYVHNVRALLDRKSTMMQNRAGQQ